MIVTFSSNAEGQQEESFRGLLIQSRLVADDTSPVGVFELEDRRNSRRSFCSPRSVSSLCKWFGCLPSMIVFCNNITRELVFGKNYYYCFAQCHVLCHALPQQCFLKFYRLQSLTGIEIPNSPFHFDGLHRHGALGQSDSGIYCEWCVECSCMDYSVLETASWVSWNLYYNRFAVVQERDMHWANQQSEIIQELGKVNA